GASWRQINAQGPGVRAAHRMAFHIALGKVFLFGGFQSDNAVWMWDGAAWTRFDGETPAARSHHAMAYDEARKRLVVFGGYAGGNENLADTWELVGDRWWIRVDPGVAH
ncbi:MAG TPA: kelch repeat-containing protein, partial [Thermoanaerobaculia bacterium]|nr:kelch repeat-containing protein [Thermoanaerobaculia bacterium]